MTTLRGSFYWNVLFRANLSMALPAIIGIYSGVLFGHAVGLGLALTLIGFVVVRARRVRVEVSPDGVVVYNLISTERLQPPLRVDIGRPLWSVPTRARPPALVEVGTGRRVPVLAAFAADNLDELRQALKTYRLTNGPRSTRRRR